MLNHFAFFAKKIDFKTKRQTQWGAKETMKKLRFFVRKYYLLLATWPRTNRYIHTYIQNWLLPPLSSITSLRLTPLMLRVLILYMSGLKNFFMSILFTLRVFARNLLRGSHRRNIFHISFLIEISNLEFESCPHS